MDPRLSSVRRMRTLALLAGVAICAILLSSNRPWWHDSSALSGAALDQAVANAPSSAARKCLQSGGVMIGSGNGQCAKWDVLHPALGLTTDQETTFDGLGNAVVNDSRPLPMFGLPPTAVFALLAFAFVILAAATRSLLAAVGSVVLGAQAFRSLSALAKVMNQPVPGLPSMQPTMWYTLFQGTIAIGTVVLAGGVVVAAATERIRERQQQLEDGTHVPMAERLRVIAKAASSTSSSALQAEVKTEPKR
jgi:hypothetical protein